MKEETAVPVSERMNAERKASVWRIEEIWKNASSGPDKSVKSTGAAGGNGNSADEKGNAREGNPLDWSLNGKTGKLMITGSGKIPDYACPGKAADPAASRSRLAPWSDVMDRITEVEIAEGITEIGMNAFRDCKNLKRATLPATLCRIHAFAFRGCESLENIRSDRPEFRYIYDDREYSKDETVVFGVGAFHGVPWCGSRWGDFYIVDNSLYVCFTAARKIDLPDTVKVLKSFSMSYLDADVVNLPNKLEVIENFAFADSRIQKSMRLPDSLKEIMPYALADCEGRSASFPPTWKLRKCHLERAGMKPVRRQKTPEFINQFSIAMENDSRLGGFRRIKLVENKPVHHRDGTVTGVRYNDTVSLGESMYRKIRAGRTILCITTKDCRVLSVKSFVWNDYTSQPEEYLMFPVKDDKKDVRVWDDTFIRLDRNTFMNIFPEEDAETLVYEGRIRSVDRDAAEEWFWYKDSEDYAGTMECDLLKRWLACHPAMYVSSADENRYNDLVHDGAAV